MTSIPPLAPRNPQGPDHVAPAAAEKPDTMRYLLGGWSVMVFGELAHQLLNAIGLVIEPAALKQAATDAARAQGQEVSDALIAVSMYTSIAMMTLFQLLIIVVLAVALRAVAGRKKWADAARRLLTVFSIFFVIRTVLVVVAPAAAAGAGQLPIAFTAVLGVIQIVVGVAAACGLFYASRKDVQEALGSNDKNGKKDG